MKHLCCGNDRPSQYIAFLDNGFLNQRHAFEIYFNAEIAACNHNGMRRRHDTVDVLHRFVLFDFRHDRNIPTVLRDDFACRINIGGPADETESDRVHTFLKADKDVVAVLTRQGIDVHFRTRQIDAFMRAEHAAHDHTANNVRRSYLFDSQLDIAVREKNRVPH